RPPDRPAPGQLPAGLLAPGADRRRGPDHRRGGERAGDLIRAIRPTHPTFPLYPVGQDLVTRMRTWRESDTTARAGADHGQGRGRTGFTRVGVAKPRHRDPSAPRADGHAPR